jgi:hypothetical protein
MDRSAASADGGIRRTSCITSEKLPEKKMTINRLLFVDRRPRLDALAQIAIVVLSPIAIALLAEAGPSARWGFVVGLLVQPFWIYATARARQAGALIVSILYLAIWIRGIVNHFPGFLS